MTDPRKRELLDQDTADLLRGVLHREADAVRPSPDGLARILAAAHAEPPAEAPTIGTPRERVGDARTAPPLDDVRRGPQTLQLDTVRPGTLAALRPADGDKGGVIRRLVPRPRPGRRGVGRWLPVAAAAVTVLVLGGGIGAVRLGMIHAPGLAAASSPRPTQTSRPVAPQPLPVYLAAQEQGRWALVREFIAAKSDEPAQRLDAALRLAVAGAGSDPDLTSVWAALKVTGGLSARITGDGVTISLSPELLGPDVVAPGGTTRTAMARLAVQQLVWTATAVLSTDAPVHVEGPTTTSLLFGALPLGTDVVRATGANDPRAPVWISSINDGAELPAGTVLVRGDAFTTSTRIVDWTLNEPDGSSWTMGQAQLTLDGKAPHVGDRGTFEIHVTLPGPGRYQLSVVQKWPSTGDPSATWTDTKTIVVH